jgi:hypothetical protein
MAMTWKTINLCEIFMLFCYKLFKILLKDFLEYCFFYCQILFLKKEKKKIIDITFYYI